MRRKIKVGIVGCGAIGSELAMFINKELDEYFKIEGVCEVELLKARNLAKRLKGRVRTFELDELIARNDLIIEAASVACAEEIIKKIAKTSKAVIVLSVGAFVKNPKLLNLIAGCSQVHIPSGAISGIDGISSLSMAKISKLRLLTSKPPSSLAGISYLKDKGIDVFKVKKDMIVFRGGIKEAIKYFPKNINVAATLFLASNFRNIEVVIELKPGIKRNIHHIEIDSDCARLKIEIENVPSRVNPKTSAMAILSTKNLLKKIVSNIKIGS